MHRLRQSAGSWRLPSRTRSERLLEQCARALLAGPAELAPERCGDAFGALACCRPLPHTAVGELRRKARRAQRDPGASAARAHQRDTLGFWRTALRAAGRVRAPRTAGICARLRKGLVGRARIADRLSHRPSRAARSDSGNHVSDVFGSDFGAGATRQVERRVVLAVAVERERESEQRVLARVVVDHRFAIRHDRAPQLARAGACSASASIAIARARARVVELARQQPLEHARRQLGLARGARAERRGQRVRHGVVERLRPQLPALARTRHCFRVTRERVRARARAAPRPRHTRRSARSPRRPRSRRLRRGWRRSASRPRRRCSALRAEAGRTNFVPEVRSARSVARRVASDARTRARSRAAAHRRRGGMSACGAAWLRARLRGRRITCCASLPTRRRLALILRP